jgi:hypothetical protein
VFSSSSIAYPSSKSQPDIVRQLARKRAAVPMPSDALVGLWRGDREPPSHIKPSDHRRS